jgi:DNA-binding NarL/FixJ family response regulator
MKIQRKRFPTVPMLVVSAHDDGSTIEKVMAAGAAGFVPKAQSADRLLDSLNRVLAGEIVDPGASPTYPIGIDSPEIMEPAGGRTRAKDIGLTRRQMDVLNLLVKGKTNREIAVLLGLTEGTVKLHVTAVLKALNVKSRTQALVAAKRHRIGTS